MHDLAKKGEHMKHGRSMPKSSSVPWLRNGLTIAVMLGLLVPATASAAPHAAEDEQTAATSAPTSTTEPTEPSQSDQDDQGEDGDQQGEGESAEPDAATLATLAEQTDPSTLAGPTTLTSAQMEAILNGASAEDAVIETEEDAVAEPHESCTESTGWCVTTKVIGEEDAADEGGAGFSTFSAADHCAIPGYTGAPLTDRTNYCWSIEYTVETRAGWPVAQVVGQAKGRTYFQAIGNTTDTMMQFRLHLETTTWWGQIDGWAFNAWSNCAECVEVANYPIYNEPGGPGKTMYSAQYFKPNWGSSVLKTPYGGYNWNFIDPLGHNITQPGGTSSGNHVFRCDIGQYGGGSGCVILGSVAKHTVGSTLLPSYYQHLVNARNSGLPGFSAGSALSYAKDPSIQTRNREASCQPGFIPKPAAPSSQYSCDEYPFASTYQGAYVNRSAPRSFPGCFMNDPVAYGPNGYSRCYINALQNSKAGSDLGVFYLQQRMANGDAFYVNLVG